MIVLSLFPLLTVVELYFECTLKEIVNTSLKRVENCPRVTSSMVTVHIEMLTLWLWAIFAVCGPEVTAMSPMSRMAPSYQGRLTGY